jgi:CheY-like chemotaxis protein
MPYPFDSASFGELAADAARLAASADEHERRLRSLIDDLEPDGDRRVVTTLRELCVAALDQRRVAQGLRRRLLGDLTAPKSEEATARPLVLIVDDSPDNRDMAALLLETSGFDTITAGNGLEGVIAAHNTRPAVVIMDVAMPVLDGVQATRLLKASRMTHHIAVIAYTATLALEETPVARLFAEVLQKPASPETIVGIVQRFAVPRAPEAA